MKFYLFQMEISERNPNSIASYKFMSATKCAEAAGWNRSFLCLTQAESDGAVQGHIQLYREFHFYGSRASGYSHKGA